MGWNSDGPIIPDIPKTIEYIDIATGKNFFSTNFAIIDDLDGISKAIKIPVIREIIINTKGFINLKNIKILI